MDTIGDAVIEAVVAVLTLLAMFPLFGFYAGVAENLKTWAAVRMISGSTNNQLYKGPRNG